MFAEIIQAKNNTKSMIERIKISRIAGEYITLKTCPQEVSRPSSNRRLISYKKIAIKGPNKANPAIIGKRSCTVLASEAHNHITMPIKGYKMIAKK